MPDVIVVGGGLAGLAAAAALGEAGYRVRVFEARGFPGGRATSYPYAPGDQPGETIDNGQHILLRCCANLQNFYRRLGVADQVEFYREFYVIEPGGRTSVLRPGALPPPLHFSGSFAKLPYLTLLDKLAIVYAMIALRHEYGRRKDLDRITMLDWLHEKHQPAGAIQRFWRQILVPAVNEDLDRMAAGHGFQLFWLSFLATEDGYQLGLPKVPLAELYTGEAWERIPNVELHLRTPVDKLERGDTGGLAGMIAGGTRYEADYYILAVPFERAESLAPWLGLNLTLFEYSPITGIHLWFDRPVTELVHAALLDRTIQALYTKDGGRYVQLVAGASRSLTPMPRADVIALALQELAEFLPEVRQAKLEKAHVVKEVQATFSARPGLETARPGPGTVTANLFLAGDWTNSGWPPTMEGAVRSGYIAAEAVAAVSGQRRRFLLADVA